jgi:hypothetical protein
MAVRREESVDFFFCLAVLGENPPNVQIIQLFILRHHYPVGCAPLSPEVSSLLSFLVGEAQIADFVNKRLPAHHRGRSRE